MIDDSIAAVIFEPVQGVAGAYDLSTEFIEALRSETRRHDVILIADEVQSGMGRSGHFFAVQAHGVDPDIITSAKALGGGIPCGAVLCTHEVAALFGTGDLGTTFGGGPIAAAAIAATIQAISDEHLLANVREREAQIREKCVVGPIRKIQPFTKTTKNNSNGRDLSETPNPTSRLGISRSLSQQFLSSSCQP